MRGLAVLWTVVLTSAFTLPARAAALDGIDLTLSREPGNKVRLAWTGDIPAFSVHRAVYPSAVTDISSKIGDTNDNGWVDTPPAGQVFYYAVLGDCPSGESACGGRCELDADGDLYCDGLDNCPAVVNADQADRDGDTAGDACDYCRNDPQKVDRGQCGCFKAESTGDADGDGVIDCRDQCPGSDDMLDADRGGLPDGCDPCPTGLCSLDLPDRFYAELPNHQALRVSRDGRWIAAFELSSGRGVLIPTEDLIRDPSDTSHFEYMGDEEIASIRGFSDDDNLVLANVHTYVRESASEVIATGIYDRTNGTWEILGLYDDTIDIDTCRYYSEAGDMTSDGKVVYGRTPTVENPCSLIGFRYDRGADDWKLFGGPEGSVGVVEAVSGDGRRIVGSEARTSVGTQSGVVWTYSPPETFAPQWMDDFGSASDVTFDGSAAAVSSGGRAHRWTAAGGLQRLGDEGTLNADYSVRAVAISDGGNLVVGFHTQLLASVLPFSWKEGSGFGSLKNYLLWVGFTSGQLGRFDDSFLPWDLSGNGRIIVGRTGTSSGLPGWVAITPE